MFHKSVLALLAVVTIGVLSWVDWPSRAASPGPFGTARVRLYSNGEVVGQWEAVGPGHVDGDTFVFPIRKGARDLDVRIRGTFSFEVQP